MIEPRRPEPVLSWRNRLQDQIERVRQRVRRGPHESASQRRAVAAQLVDVRAPDSGPSLAFTALLAVGSALLALVGLWAWQSWSNRSSEPIDALLPMFAESQLDTSLVADDLVGNESRPATPDDAPASSIPAGEQQEPTPADSAGVAPAVAIIVHVSGAVSDPGVVELVDGARVFEAVSEAGGATALADLDRVNLAARVVDGERIHVPAVGEDPLPQLMSATRPSIDTDGSEDEDRLIDINAATVADLESLPGIGPAIAEAIVRTRDDRGPFLTVDELLDVPGIGEAKLALLSPHVMVGSSRG